jgi:hypothetical protein
MQFRDLVLQVGEFRICESKIWSWFPRDPDLNVGECASGGVEAVFSMSSAPSSSGNMRLCNPLLWRNDASVVYNCWWSSPGQSSSGSGPAKITIIFYSHRYETPQPEGPGSGIYFSQEHGDPVIYLGIDFLFHRLLHIAGLKCRYSNPPPHGPLSTEPSSFLITSRHRPQRKHPVSTVIVQLLHYYESAT